MGRRILGKPEEGDRATDALERLRGRNHRVYTAICLITPDDRKRERVVETRIRFRNFSDAEIRDYIASGEWKGKAGGYGIQGIAGGFVVKLVGSYTSVVGLPLTEVVTLLQGEGYPVSVFLAEPRRDRDRVSPKADPGSTQRSGRKAAKGPKCPICGKPAVQAYRPFCSSACADEDLGRWLGGRYVVPGEPVGQRGDEDQE